MLVVWTQHCFFPSFSLFILYLPQISDNCWLKISSCLTLTAAWHSGDGFRLRPHTHTHNSTVWMSEVYNASFAAAAAALSGFQSSNFWNRYFHFWLKNRCPLSSEEQRDEPNVNVWLHPGDAEFRSLMQMRPYIMWASTVSHSSRSTPQTGSNIRGFKVKNLLPRCLWEGECVSKESVQRSKDLTAQLLKDSMSKLHFVFIKSS